MRKPKCSAFLIVSSSFVCLLGTGCGQTKPSCAIEGKTAVFASSSLTPKEYLEKNHASFLEIGKQPYRMDFEIKDAEQDSSYEIYISGDSFNVTLHGSSAYPNVSFQATKPDYTKYGRRYVVVAYHHNEQTSYAGFAYGCPEADPSVLQEIRSIPKGKITIQTDSNTYVIEKEDEIQSFYSCFDNIALVYLEEEVLRPVPGSTFTPTWYTVDIGEENGTRIDFRKDNSFLRYRGIQYAAIGCTFKTWLYHIATD